MKTKIYRGQMRIYRVNASVPFHKASSLPKLSLYNQISTIYSEKIMQDLDLDFPNNGTQFFAFKILHFLNIA